MFAESIDRVALPKLSASFGGFSAIEFVDNGQTAWIQGDKGLLVLANIRRDSNGRLSELSIQKSAALKKPDGTAVGPGSSDAEGLAIGPDGALFVSFEGPARVWRYANPWGLASALPEHRDFAGMQANSALEALAADQQGRLYAIPERSGSLDRPFPVYRLSNQWEIAFHVQRRGDFLIVGADIGSDNRLYVLERHLSLLGFQSRIRRVDLDGGDEVTLWVSSRGQFDNLEGITLWDAPDGRRAVLVSDDNLTPFLRSELIEIALPN